MGLIGIVACEPIDKKLNLIYDIYQPQIVVYGFVNNLNKVEVQVLKSIPPNQPKAPHNLENPQVELYENGQFLTLLTQEDSSFFTLPADVKIDPKNEYSIKVSATNIPAVGSPVQKIPDELKIDSLTITKDTVHWTGEFLVFYFTDTEAAKHYYYFNAQIINNTDTFFHEIFPMYSVLDAENFEGNTKTYSLPLYLSFGEEDTVVIDAYFYNLSEDIGKYVHSVEEYEAANEMPLMEQNRMVYTNIKSGFGLWGAYSLVKKKIFYSQSQQKIIKIE